MEVAGANLLFSTVIAFSSGHAIFVSARSFLRDVSVTEMVEHPEDEQSPVRPPALPRLRDEAQRERLVDFLLDALFHSTADSSYHQAQSRPPFTAAGGDVFSPPHGRLTRCGGTGHEEPCSQEHVLANRALARKVLLSRLSLKERHFEHLRRRVEGYKGEAEGDMAQALRNPLHIINGVAYYLSTTNHLSPEQRRDFCDIIVQETGRLATLVESLLMHCDVD